MLQSLQTAVARVVRFLLFRHHEKPGVPVKRQDINDVITVRIIPGPAGSIHPTDLHLTRPHGPSTHGLSFYAALQIPFDVLNTACLAHLIPSDKPSWPCFACCLCSCLWPCLLGCRQRAQGWPCGKEAACSGAAPGRCPAGKNLWSGAAGAQETRNRSEGGGGRECHADAARVCADIDKGGAGSSLRSGGNTSSRQCWARWDGGSGGAGGCTWHVDTCMLKTQCLSLPGVFKKRKPCFRLDVLARHRVQVSCFPCVAKCVILDWLLYVSTGEGAAAGAAAGAAGGSNGPAAAAAAAAAGGPGGQMYKLLSMLPTELLMHYGQHIHENQGEGIYYSQNFTLSVGNQVMHRGRLSVCGSHALAADHTAVCLSFHATPAASQVALQNLPPAVQTALYKRKRNVLEAHTLALQRMLQLPVR